MSELCPIARTNTASLPAIISLTRRYTIASSRWYEPPAWVEMRCVASYHGDDHVTTIYAPAFPVVRPLTLALPFLNESTPGGRQPASTSPPRHS